MSLSSPARTSLGVACSEATLASGITHASLGLPDAADIKGKYTKQVLAAATSASEATVTIQMLAIGSAITDGQDIVYKGTCGVAGMTWEIDAGASEVADKYLPKV
ncbi:MAG: pilin [Rhodoferax sp.]|nr:pilin [Rhodoferax sp.]